MKFNFGKSNISTFNVSDNVHFTDFLILISQFIIGDWQILYNLFVITLCIRRRRIVGEVSNFTIAVQHFIFKDL